MAGTGDASATVARVVAGTGLDSAFGAGGQRFFDYGQPSTNGAADVTLEPGGKIDVAGYGGTANDFHLTRLTANGALDPSLGGKSTVDADFGGDDNASALALQANGKIVLAGTTGGDFGIVRFQPAVRPMTRSARVASGPSVPGSRYRLRDGAAAGREDRGGRTSPQPPPPVRWCGCRATRPPQAAARAALAGDDEGVSLRWERATIVGTNKKNRLRGTRRADVIVGLGGNDTISGLNGNDIVCGGKGDDKVSGGSGKDKLYGDSGKDRLSGDSGNDRESGGSGNDKLLGGSGKDILAGGSGKDGLKGGPGKDKLNGGGGKDKCAGRDRKQSCWRTARARPP